MGRKVWVPVVSGPLAPYAAGFWSWLASRAYSSSAAADRLYQLGAALLEGPHAACGMTSWA
jgi:hypothetical protein